MNILHYNMEYFDSKNNKIKSRNIIKNIMNDYTKI